MCGAQAARGPGLGAQSLWAGGREPLGQALQGAVLSLPPPSRKRASRGPGWAGLGAAAALGSGGGGREWGSSAPVFSEACSSPCSVDLCLVLRTVVQL